jgi:hypothetical protein
MAACERIAKICSLLPETGSDASAAYKLADSALMLGSNNKEFLPWAQMTKGMTEYRAGRFSEAIDWLQKSLAGETVPGTLKVTAYATLGMAQYDSGGPVFVVDLPGGTPALVTQAYDRYRYPVLTPDGSTVVAEQAGDLWRIALP